MPEGEPAISFPGTCPPDKAVEVGRVQHKDDTYIYYRTQDGTIYYATERGLVFAKQMEENIRQRRLKKDRVIIERS